MHSSVTQPPQAVDSIDDDATTERFMRDEPTERWLRTTGLVDVVRAGGEIRVVRVEAAE